MKTYFVDVIFGIKQDENTRLLEWYTFDQRLQIVNYEKMYLFLGNR